MTTAEWVSERAPSNEDRTAQVEALIQCPHRLEIRMRLDRAGRPRYLRQCVTCGERVGHQVARHEVPASARSFDEPAEARRRHQREAAWQRVHDEARRAELIAWRTEHARYLTTPQWARLRDAVLQRAGGRCEGCGIRGATQVHHLTYARWQREMLFDLVAVCRACHERIHEVSA